MAWRRAQRTKKCTRCSRLGCICREIDRGHVAAAKAKGLPDPRPHLCPRPGCGHTVRGGVCPGPGC